MPSSVAIDEFLEACRKAGADIASDARCHPLQFSTDPQMSERLLQLIITGEKTGTFAVDWQFDDRPAARPAPGDFYMFLDHAGLPRALARLTVCEVVAFDAIDEARVQCEGPALRELEAWRRLHWDYWSRLLADSGRKPARDMPVLCQRFELAWPLPAD